MSDSVRPHRRQPTRLRYPWDSPGKNTGVGCHFLLQCMKVKVKSLSHVGLFAPHGPQPTRLLRQWDFPGKSTGVGCRCLLCQNCLAGKQFWHDGWCNRKLYLLADGSSGCWGWKCESGGIGQWKRESGHCEFEMVIK